MKSYWFAATILLLGTWPSVSRACVSGAGQSTAETPVQQPQPANSTANPQDPAKAQGPATVAKATASDSAIPSAESGQQTKNAYMLVELTRTLKAKKLKPGDKIKAEVTQDVLSHGKVIIPVETELVGHITEVSVRDGNAGESRLGLVFDKILLKHFRDINFKAVIQAVAPAVIRKSRVDQPSQMLPPSMLGGADRQTGAASGGRPGGQFSRTQGAPGGSATTTLTTPMTVKQSPSGTAASGTAAAQLEVSPGGKPLSVGMPQGIRGMKGLSLTTTPSASTPGPVVVSNTDNVKLDSGTQILLRVVTIEKPKITEKPQ
jgi:biotin carboxyl carrier protein